VLCPECNSKIKATNYDPEFEWYECPSCDGSFTADEILKAEQERQKTSPVRAKGKLRRTQIELDETAEANVTQVPTISRSASARDGRSQVATHEVINVMADAVEEVYREFHASIDRVNARDKALILYRTMVLEGEGATIKEKEITVPRCKAHA
jgi:DNA-directed RNA polymerase subunit M/transcription elongation factor TFIIS